MPFLTCAPCGIMNWLSGSSALLVLFLVAEMTTLGAPCESPPAEPHHLVWKGINLEVTSRRSSRDDTGGSNRYVGCAIKSLQCIRPCEHI